MAITKIHAIKTTLNKAVSYIENPDKTDGQLFISGYNTEPQTASLDFEMTATMARKAHRSASRRNQNLAYHLIQSFSPDDDLTPEQAHELGKKLASEFTEGRFEFVVATHLDKNHLHNHIIINAYSFYDYKKLRTVPYKTARQIRRISDRLCAEAELSVIEEPENIGQRYSAYIRKHQTIPMRTQVRRRLNFALARATSYDQFKSIALALGVTVLDNGKHIAYRYCGAGKAVRGNKLSDTEKYLSEGIQEQLAVNADNFTRLRKIIREAVQTAPSFDGFQDELNQKGIRTKIDKRTGAITYIMDDADESHIPEDALGPGMSRNAIIDAIKNGSDASLSDAAPMIGDMLETFQSTVHNNANTQETLVTVTNNQIIQASKNGLLLSVKDKNGNSARLMLDADHVEGKPDGSIQIALGSAFEYDIVYPDNSHGAVRGGDLIKQIELANGVQPAMIGVKNDDIKTMSLKGITLTLPQSGIDRIFIPAEFVHYDKAAGTCQVEIYENWDYSFVPVSDENTKSQRQSMKGKQLISDIASTEPSETLHPEDSLRQRIAYVERKAALANVKHLAATLNTMNRSRMSTAKDFIPQLKKIQQEMQHIAARISDTKEKNKQYALAVRHLETCHTYKETWLKFQRTPGPLKPLFKNKYKANLDAYRIAAEQLSQMGVQLDVDPEKVTQLIKDRERQIDLDSTRLNDLKQQEKELLAQQSTVATLQHDESERNYNHDDVRY